MFRRPGQGAVLQDGILRYSAARRTRNQSSADWESAVSRIGNPQTFADCQSAKQQIDNLRYEKSSRGATISADTDADTDRLAVCATNTTEALKRYGALRSKGSPFAPDPCGARTAATPTVGRFGWVSRSPDRVRGLKRALPIVFTGDTVAARKTDERLCHPPSRT